MEEGDVLLCVMFPSSQALSSQSPTSLWTHPVSEWCWSGIKVLLTSWNNTVAGVAADGAIRQQFKELAALPLLLLM